VDTLPGKGRIVERGSGGEKKGTVHNNMHHTHTVLYTSLRLSVTYGGVRAP